MPDNLSLSAEHTIKIRDLRARFGEPEVYAAECTCGWTGDRRSGAGAERAARREGIVHTDAERLASQPRR
jgi:hypothetical protein